MEIMNSRREPSENLDTARKSFADGGSQSILTGPGSHSGAAIDPPKKRPTTDAKEAARAFDRLEQLDIDERREFAESPSDIAKRFASKRERIIAELPEGVATLVHKMRAAT